MILSYSLVSVSKYFISRNLESHQANSASYHQQDGNEYWLKGSDVLWLDGSLQMCINMRVAGKV